MSKAKLISICLLLTALMGSCTKEGAICGTNDPANDIGWVKNYIQTHANSRIRIYKVRYKGEYGILLESCLDQQNPFCDVYIGSFNNCSNQTIYDFGGYNSAGFIGTDYLSFWNQVSYYYLIYAN